MAHVFDAVIRLKDQFSAQLKNVNNNLTKFQKQTRYLQKSVGSTSRLFTDAGKSLTKGITIPIGTATIASGKAAIDFESAFAGVKKTVDGTKEQFDKLKQGILDASKVMPQSASEIANVAESAGQLGIQTDNILNFSKTMVMLGDATNLTADEAATSFARFANITKMPQTEFDKLGSVVVALGNNLATTEQEITAMGMRLAGAGSQIGLSQAQIMSFAGALSSVGIEAEAGGSAFSKVMIDMQLATQKGGKSLSNFAKVSGMTAKQFKQAFKEDASGAIIKFIKGLSDAKNHGSTAIKMLDDMGITEVRMRDALLRAAGAGDLFNNSLEIGTNAWKENTALVNEASQRYATTESKLKILKNRLVELGIKLGEILIPTIQKIIDKLGNLIDKFSNLDSKTQKAIVKFALISAAIGPVILLIGKLGFGVYNIISKFRKLSKTISKVGGVMKWLKSPGMIVITVIAALVVGAILLITHWDKVKECFMKVAHKISHATGISKQAVLKFVEVIKRFATIIVSKFTKAFASLKEKVGPKLTEFINTVKNAFNKLKPYLMPILAFLTGTFVAGIANTFSIVSTVISSAISTIGGIISGLLSIFSGIINFLVGVFTCNWSQAWEGVKQIFSGAVDIVKSLWNGVVSLLSAPVQAVVDILDSVFHDKIEGIKKAWENVKTFLAHPIQATVSLFKNGDLSGVKGQNALGTPYWGGGLSLVGEHGPEIVELPAGSAVHDTKNSKKILSGGSSSPTIIIQNMNVREESDIDKIATSLFSKLQLASLNRA